MKKIIISQARILHLITTLVIVPVSGALCAWLAKHFPGLPRLSPAAVEGVFITGATSGLATGLHFLHGWQWWERNVAPVVDVTAASNPTGAAGPSSPATGGTTGPVSGV